MSKFQELVAKLREIFQIDQPELDFGIYRIINARAGEIDNYLQKRLAEKVQQALSAGSEEQREQVARELKEKEKQYKADGLDPDNVPKVLELRQKLEQYNVGSNEHENAVFSHLLTFFSRYYEQGDFISQRRYKGDTYAIPYAGEEVMLHWANKDQYYTKSGENFSNYSFKLPEKNGQPGRTVHFRLVAADTAKDNRKDNDKERRFALVKAKTVIRIDDNGDEYEEKLLPVEEVSGSDGTAELIIRFEYAAQPKGTKQDKLVAEAVRAILSDQAVKSRWLDLGNRESTDKNPQRTLLEKQLAKYTSKNTADYFIHKDLGGFLRRELDFYIKNEVMNLDDVQDASAFASIEKNLRMIQCLRSIALELITFLAQLEDFQKKLWLKKKFVVSSHYCITLDRVPESLYPDIVANERQWEQWRQLGIWDGKAPGTIDDLKTAPYRMVDTSLFEEEFKAKLLQHVPDLDETTNGLLIHSDNFQALQLLQERYYEQVKCIYIDPPYNTDATPIIYKNGYRHSSWNSLMCDRLRLSKMLANIGSFFVTAIDHAEVYNLGKMKDSIFGEGNRLAIITVQHNPKGRNQAKFFSENTEYLLFYCNDFVKANFRQVAINDDVMATFTEKDDNGLFRYENFLRARTEWSRRKRPNNWYPIYISQDLQDITSVFHEGYHEVYPVTDSGEFSWKNIRSSFDELNKNGYFQARMEGGLLSIQHKYYEQQVLKNIWIDKKYQSEFNGTNLIKSIIGENDFSYPKSLFSVQDVIKVTTEKDELVLDYFAGSGTTGHAVINLNREDEGKRKYILAEMGAHFDTVLKPRLTSIIYSKDWKDGKPTAPETGISHCFKVLKLESYEDTLNNLELCHRDELGGLLKNLDQEAKDEYLLNYMLDVESRGSLLSVANFNKPFDYSLKVAVDSAGAFEQRKVDLVETFNYLIGLRVKHIDAQPQRGFVTVTGTLLSGETCLVLWRDCELLDYQGISKLCDKLAINPADNEFDVVYINGDHNIPTVITQTADEGGATRVLKLRQIEPEFLQRMFDVEDL